MGGVISACYKRFYAWSNLKNFHLRRAKRTRFARPKMSPARFARTLTPSMKHPGYGPDTYRHFIDDGIGDFRDKLHPD